MRAPLHLPEDLPISDGLARFHPQGESTLLNAVERVAEVIGYCRERHIGKLLVNTTALTGIHVPTLVERFLLAEEWAMVAHGMVVVALVIAPEYIHSKKFGVKVATDLGLTIDVFTADSDALAWLATVASPT